jgi:flagellar hook-associated protein 3 FlgL
MRITSQMLTDDSIRQLQGNIQRLAKSQEQVSTTRRLNRPSDDPSETRTAVKLHDSLAELDQFQRNIDSADRTLSATDAALSSAGEIVQRARELAIQGANGSLSTTDRQAIGVEVDQLLSALFEQARAKSAGSYLFSGFRTDVPPLLTPTGAYQGDNGAIVARTAPNTQVQINITADVAFAPALQALDALRTELNAGTQVSGATIGLIDAGQEPLLAARAMTGARQNRLADTRTYLDDGILAGKTLLSNLEDADMAQAITDMSSRQASYEAALRVNARLLQTSLLDLLQQ